LLVKEDARLNSTTSLGEYMKYNFDMHSDIIIDVRKRRNNGETGVILRNYLPRWKEGNLFGSVLTVGGDPDILGATMIDALENIDILRKEETESGGTFRLISNAGEISSLKNDGIVIGILGIEGGAVVEGDSDNIVVLKNKGIRVFGVTWNGHNNLAYGTGESDPQGLTKLGKSILKTVFDQRLLVDVSHLSEPSFWDLISIATGPVFASHSNVMECWKHPRNINREQIKAIAEMGGIVGICSYPEFLGHAPTIKTAVDHMCYIADAVGVEHVGIGADFIDYAQEEISTSIHNSPLAYADDQLYTKGYESVEKLPNFRNELNQRGFSEDEVNKILCENFLRLFKML